MDLEGWRPRHREEDPRVVWLIATVTNARGESAHRAFWVLVMPHRHHRNPWFA